MKIISKYKDYYDYLVGIYGEDNKLVLDRREKEEFLLPTIDKIIIYIADYTIEGLVTEKKDILYGDQLKPYIIDSNKRKKHWYNYSWLSKHYIRDYNQSYHIKYKNHEDWYYLNPIKTNLKTNTNNNCPIIIEINKRLFKYPKLEPLKVPSILSADKAYKILYEWLSNQINEKEKQIKEPDNKTKIINKGFDIKTSFRPNIKTT